MCVSVLSLRYLPLSSRFEISDRGAGQAGALGVQVAVDPATIGQLVGGRVHRPADVHGVGAAGVEVAARRRRERAGHVALEDDATTGPLAHRVGHRHGRDQRLGVGMGRGVVDRRGRALLDHPAEVHHCDAFAHMAHDGQVVGDEEVGQALLGLEVGEQVDDLGLHGHVEGAHRLVADHQVRAQGQRPGDGDALSLPAGELMRVAVEHGAVEADLVEQLDHPGRQVAAAVEVVDAQGLGHDLGHREAGAE